MPIQQIGKMSLENKGVWFIAHIKFVYFDANGNRHLSDKQSGNINANATKTEDPGDYGVPDGSLCYLKVIVDAGYDRQALRAFIYKKGSLGVAKYRVTDVTASKTLPYLLDVSPA